MRGGGFAGTFRTIGVKTQLASDLLKCHGQGILHWVALRAYDELGADETVDGEGGETEDTQGEGGFLKVLGLAAELDDAAGLDAQHGDLVDKPGILSFFEVFDIGRFELVGVEAVFEGVLVAARGAATAAEGTFKGVWVRGHDGAPIEIMRVGAAERKKTSWVNNRTNVLFCQVGNRKTRGHHEPPARNTRTRSENKMNRDKNG